MRLEQLATGRRIPLAQSDLPELTILMPCLNEAETLARCIRKAILFLSRTGISGEILIADNGSVDGSRAIAESLGARVVLEQPEAMAATADRHPRRARTLCHHG